jgi:hypothetical protein
MLIVPVMMMMGMDKSMKILMDGILMAMGCLMVGK